MAETIGRVGWRNYVSPLPNPLWNGMLAYYTADNTANDSKGTANGALTNGATYGTGKINGGFSFDGIDDTVTLSNTVTKFSSSTPFTYNVWVKAVSRTGFIYMDANASAAGTSIGFYGGALAFTIGDVAQWFGTSVVIPLNTWTMVTVTYNGIVNQSNNLLFYTNGTFAEGLKMDVSFNLSTASSNKQIGSGGWRGFFNGNLDELGIWGRALTAAEVTELYNGGAGKQYVAPVEASIVSSGLIMNLDARNALSYSGTGTVWTDLSGNGNNGTLVNGTSYSSANGGTMVFDGINDYIRILTGLSASNTLSVWFKQPAATGGGLLETNSLTGVGSGSSQLFVGLGADYLRTYGEPYGYSPNSAYTPTNWYNVTITGSSGGVRNIYMNGVLTATKSNIPNYGYNSAINIGVAYPGYFNGNVPVVHLYNRVLTQAEITANFNALKSRYGL